MSRESVSRLFLSAAIFNWVIALGLFFVPGPFLGLIHVSPAPEQTTWIQQFAGLVFFLGVGYYWLSRDFETNIPLARLAIWGKSGVVVIALSNVWRGDISWQIMIPAAADGVFAILFLRAINSLPEWNAGAPA